MEAADARMQATLDMLMKENNIASYSELEAKIIEALPADERQEIIDMLDEIRKVDETSAKAFSIVGFIITFSAGTALAANTVSLIKSGAFIANSRLTFKAFSLLAKGSFSEARALLKVASSTSKLLKTGFETSTKLGKVLRYARIAGEVLSVLGFVTDGVLAIMAAVQGAKQRDELRAKIIELFADRISVSLMEELALDTIAFQGSVEDLLDSQGDEDLDEDEKELLTRIAAKRLGKRLDDLWVNRSYESAAGTWTQLDVNRSSFTSEDPSVAAAISTLEDISSVKGGE